MKLKNRMLAIILLLIWSAPVSAETVKIASIFSKTGPAAVGNKTTIDGIRFAVDELNQQGGLLGRKVTLFEIDNHSTALQSKKAAEKAVRHGVVAVFGANWSSHSLAMAPVLQKAGIPMISPFSTNPDVTKVGDYIYRICFIDSFQGRIMAEFATRDLKAKTAAILINASGRYSGGLADFFRQRFNQLGGKVLMESSYLKETEDFTAQVRRIAALQPDVVFIPGNIVDSGHFIKQARGAGLSLPILGGDGWGDAMYQFAGDELHGSFYSGHWHEDIKDDKSRDFVKRYSEIHGDVEKDAAALAHDTVFLYADAVLRADSLKPGKVREALASTRHFRGVTGDITFDRNGDPIKPAVIMKFEGNRSVYVKSVHP